MKNQDLYQLFIDELADMYSSEHQIVKSLPKLIQLASLTDLKDGLKQHLEETKNQVKRIEKIFSILDLPAKEIPCEAMAGLVKEAASLTENRVQSAVLDAAIISACLKIEHYEIASYNTLRSFAKHLGLDSAVIDLIKANLDEENSADKKLTKIADGTLLFSGVNKDAAEVGTYATGSTGAIGPKPRR